MVLMSWTIPVFVNTRSCGTDGPGRAGGRSGPQTARQSAGRWVALALLLLGATLAAGARAGTPAEASCPPLLRHSFNVLQGGQPRSLCEFAGKVLLVVNTASQCGYTPQYEGLEALQRQYRERGLVVLGFPSNDFGGQEPGSNKDIASFCRTAYGIDFPMFEKAEGTKLTANPFYAELVARSGRTPGWNFHKYLVDRSGATVRSFDSKVAPQSRELVAAVESLLAATPRNGVVR